MLSPPPSPFASSRQSYFQSTGSKAIPRARPSTRRLRILVFLIPLLLYLVAVFSRHVNLFGRIFQDSLQSSLSFPIGIFHSRAIDHRTQMKRRATVSDDTLYLALDNNVPTVPSNPSAGAKIIPNPFPQPFDVSLSLNFSSASCQNFFLNFTQSAEFRRCRPLSLLMESSSAFTQAESNLTLLNGILWGTCNTDPSISDCESETNSLTQQLQTSCSVELKQGNVLVKQALTGFQMYGAMRQAGCLIDESKNSYCFSEAVANKSPADLYFYQLPYGNQLPNGTVPSCSTCIKSVLAVYAQAVTPPSGGNSVGIPLDDTYGPAARIAAQQCGSVYAQQVNLSSAAMVSRSFITTTLRFILMLVLLSAML